MINKYKTEERRPHGCDGCRNHTSTEKFEGYCNNQLWLCSECFIKLVEDGITTK